MPAIFHAYGSGSVTNAYVAANAIPLQYDEADPTSANIPAKCALYGIQVQFSGRGGGATTLTLFISRDAAGEIPLTGEISLPLAGGYAVGSTGGGNSASFAQPILYQYDSTTDVEGVLYLQAKWNAGVGDVEAKLSGVP